VALLALRLAEREVQRWLEETQCSLGHAPLDREYALQSDGRHKDARTHATRKTVKVNRGGAEKRTTRR
jgi:hypothetical protein